MESIRIEARPAQLRVVFPRWPRARRPLLWLAAGLAWPPVGLALAGWGHLDQLPAMALGVLPPLLVLVAQAPALADALSARAIVLTRLADGTVATGGAPGWPPAAYTVAVASQPRRLGRTVHRLTLVARQEAGSATVDVGLLDVRLPHEEDASALAAALERFIRAG